MYLVYSSTHHTFTVEPWEAGPDAIKVLQLDDPDSVVLLLRNKEELDDLIDKMQTISRREAGE